MLGDLIDAASNLAKGTHATIGTFGRPELRPVDELSSPYYINLEVSDEPGVLAAVAGVFGSHTVSIHSMEQEVLEPPEEGRARLISLPMWPTRRTFAQRCTNWDHWTR